LSIPYPVAVAPAAAANGHTMGLLLRGRDTAAKASVQGAGFVKTVVAKLGLGRVGQWVLRGCAWLVGRVSMVTAYFGPKTSIAYVVSGQTGQDIIKGAAKIAFSVLTWPLRKVYNALLWAATKVGLRKAIETPAAYAAIFIVGTATWVGEKADWLLNPSTFWMSAIHTVSAFRVHWLLSKMAWIPGPIGVVLKGVALVSLAFGVARLVARVFGVTSEDIIDVIEDTINEVDSPVVHAKAEAKVTEHIVTVEQHLAKAKRAAESIGAEVVGERFTEHTQNDGTKVTVTNVTDAEMAEQGMVRVGHTTLDDGTQVPAYAPKAQSDEQIAFDYLQNHTTEEMARAVLNDEVPAVPKVMSKNQAKKILRDLELEAKALGKSSK
jgi:hypothetical protein